MINSLEEQQRINQSQKIEQPFQLFVYGQEQNITEYSLKSIFVREGNISSIFIPEQFGEGWRYGFVTMKNQKEAFKAYDRFDFYGYNYILRISIKLIQNISDFIKSGDIDKLQIKTIIESNKLQYEEKVLKLNELFKEYQKMNEFQILLLFNTKTFISIQRQLNQCSSSYEISLMNIIEAVAERGSKLLKMHNHLDIDLNTPLYYHMKRSGLVAKIESVLLSNIFIEQESNIKHFSYLSVQLIRTYMFIMNENNIEKDLLKIFSTVITKNITYLIEQIKIKQNEQQNSDQINADIDNIMKSLTKTLHAFDITSRNSSANCNTLSNLQINKELIVPLIHINCPSQLNCQHNIHMNQSPIQQLLIAEAYNVLGIFSQFNSELHDYLIKNHSLLSHITTLIISFAANTIFSYHKFDKNQQQLQNITFIHPSIIVAVLKFLNNFLLYDNKRTETILQNEENYSIQIQKFSRNCLNQILQHGDETCISLFSKSGYINALVISISSDNLYFQDKTHDFPSSLQLIKNFFTILHIGREQTFRFLQIPPQPTFTQVSYEQFEEQGGSEEVEAQLTNVKEASEVKNDILYYYKDLKSRFI